MIFFDLDKQKTDYFFNDLIIGFALHFASKVISNETAKDVLILLRKVVEMGKFTPLITSDAHPVHWTPEILGEREDYFVHQAHSQSLDAGSVLFWDLRGEFYRIGFEDA